MAFDLKWREDVEAENQLAQVGLEWEPIQMPPVAIDWELSRDNGARLSNPLIEELLEDYMEGMINGDIFPRPVVWAPKKLYVIQSGNHRCECVRRLRDRLPKNYKIPAYLITTNDPMLVEIFMRAANNTHGQRQSKSDRVKQAVYCVRSLGMTSRNAARVFLISDTVINTHLRAEDTRRRLARLNVSNVSSLNTTQLSVLSRVPDDSVLAKVGTIAAQYHPPGDRLERAVKSIEKATSTAGRLKKAGAIEREIKADSDNGHRKATSKLIAKPRREKVIRQLSNLCEFLDHGNDGEGCCDFSSIQCNNKSDQERVSGLWRRLQYRMRMIVKGS